MNEFKHLTGADGLIAHLTNEPLEPGRARALTADGTLKVCFSYKGKIGLFARRKTHADILFPYPVTTVYFVGDLQSLTRPQLDEVVEHTAQVPGTMGFVTTRSKADLLHPFEVIPVRKLHAHPDIDMSNLLREGFFWGRVQSEVRCNGRVIQPAMHDRCLLPVDRWRIWSDELRAVFQTQGTFMKKGALVVALEHEWLSIEVDISDATRNGLKAAAHTGQHGNWDKDKAIAWAVSKGKVKQPSPAGALATAWRGSARQHRIKG